MMLLFHFLKMQLLNNFLNNQRNDAGYFYSLNCCWCHSSQSQSLLLLLILCRLRDSSSGLPLQYNPVVCKIITGFWWDCRTCRRYMENFLETFTGLAHCMPRSRKVITILYQQFFQTSLMPILHIHFAACVGTCTPLSFSYLKNISWRPGCEVLIRCL